MNGKTRNQLLAFVALALLLVILAWYVTTRQKYYTYTTLVSIAYQPAAQGPPYLTFSFSQPLDPQQVSGNTAILRGFQVGASSPTGSQAAQPLLAALSQMPFVPDAQLRADMLTTNTLPAGSTLWGPMTITGAGTIQFAVPKK